MDKLGELLGGMEPHAAAKAIAKAARDVFPLLSEEKRREVITEMLGDPGGDKVVELVHL